MTSKRLKQNIKLLKRKILHRDFFGLFFFLEKVFFYFLFSFILRNKLPVIGVENDISIKKILKSKSCDTC